MELAGPRGAPAPLSMYMIGGANGAIAPAHHTQLPLDFVPLAPEQQKPKPYSCMRTAIRRLP